MKIDVAFGSHLWNEGLDSAPVKKITITEATQEEFRKIMDLLGYK